MIRVAPAAEPAQFDERVRQPGLADRHWRRLVPKRPFRLPFKPYWHRVTDDLLASYNRTCAYLSMYIPKGVGTPSVDHMVAKSKAWDQVYEWTTTDSRVC